MTPNTLTLTKAAKRASADQEVALTAWPRPCRNAVLQAAALSMVDQGVYSGTRFATTILIGRLCGQNDLGVYYLTMSIVMFAQGIQSQVIRAPYTVHCQHRTGSALHTYQGSMIAHQLVLAAVSITFVLIAGLLATLGGSDPAMGATLALLAVVITPLLMREFVRGLTIAHLDMHGLLRLDLAVAILQIGAVGFLAWYDLLTVPVALLVVGACGFAPTAVWLWARRDSIHLSRTRIVADWATNWIFARWALLSHLFGSTAPLIVAWILAAVQGTDATGRFAASMTVAAMAHVAVGGLANLAAPRTARAFAEGGAGLVRKRMVTTAAMLSAPALGFVVLAALWAEQMAIWIYGDQFFGCGMTVTVLGLWFLTNNLGIAAGCSLWAIGQPRANLPADIVAFTLTAILAVLGSLYYGALGAACALLVGVIGGTTIRWITVDRRLSQLSPASPPASEEEVICE